MNQRNYWISDVHYNANDITLKIVDTETWQSCYLGLNDHEHLQQYLPYFEQTDLDLIEHLRRLESEGDLKYNFWVSAVNYLESGISFNLMDLETGKVWTIALHDEETLKKFMPYLKPADVALIERLKMMDSK